ncbi:unnamed protein product [Brassicogethes aeneus]|uniref:G/T mismatch-specific thymine DNA glycosylase n=1 Tax=Brassicogethes aeneus TaxID=1431903 RepID=A0A9P0FP05_BRAAE|nr:unnamed protein product [Brassicogethes aeneus]
MHEPYFADHYVMPEFSQELNGGIPRPVKERKKHDRFNGMPEEEVSKRTLPDHLTENLDIIIIGINPGLFAAYKGHHYAGPGNHFWKCLYLAGLTSQQMSADEDYKLMQVGIGFTNMVSRATKGSADLTRKEIKEGSQILLEKLRKFRPKIAVFNGKLIYEVFSGKKDFKFGRQPDLVEGTNTHMWVMPSSSARCAQLPRAADKVPFYAALKKFRDYLNGVITEINEEEMVFTEPRVKSCYEAEPKPDPYSTDLTDISNAVIKNEDGTIVPSKKKRGRPKKIKVEGEEPPPKPVVRKPPPIQNNNCDFPKKKRGRPKKVKVDNLDMTPNDNTSSSNPSHNAGGGTNMSQCYSNQSPIHQSSGSFYQMGGPALTPPNSSSGLYAPQPQVGQPYSQSPRPQYASQSPRPQYASQSPRPQQYASQSPRPHSQPFTHSDLSSEISAAISSEQLGSPASPIGPLDFEPPHTMADEAECRLGTSPAPSSASEHSNVVRSHYPSYHSTHYNMEPPPSGQGGGAQDAQGLAQYQQSPRANQDIASKSLSGLESLVDQIPSITDGEAPLAESPAEHHYSSSSSGGGGQFSNYPAQRVGGGSPPVPSGYVNYPPPPPSPAGYPLYPTPSWGGGHHYDGMPPLAYPQLPYATQGYGGGHHPAAIHVPSPNYPYYSSYPGTATGAHPPPGYPPYLGGF